MNNLFILQSGHGGHFRNATPPLSFGRTAFCTSSKQHTSRALEERQIVVFPNGIMGRIVGYIRLMQLEPLVTSQTSTATLAI